MQDNDKWCPENDFAYQAEMAALEPNSVNWMNRALEAEKELEKREVEITWTPEQFERMLGKLNQLFLQSKQKENVVEFVFTSSADSSEYNFGFTTDENNE